ncbi:hypothetical protein [Escherichia coli]|uniref:hypothetical protein n=1 Tax=Escherichia coli TaxID=562 RepID=UPI00183E897D|nr:hypothetical protein [Escherichia coli]EFL7756059.1 hypothetical protein [Escherichia coli]EGZ0532414.1 hypothetical protein [Escherichia coli]ELI4679020.1 hypothetical protein [Escherichia coli]HAV9202512.1 hypothetical protein [Escherichia coli]
MAEKPPLTHGVPAFIAPPPDRGTVDGGSESKESLHYEQLQSFTITRRPPLTR